ncbi:MAG: hypothetical protein CSA21_01365 [Deltaproteobacteria bacterium]|nr:MAG: hypothetical protein CSA21_01365 [Deltaproteobacteria bacterium]
MLSVSPHAGVQYFLPEQQVELVPLAGGNINNTWLCTSEDGCRRILQRLRRSIFPEPELIMANLEALVAQRTPESPLLPTPYQGRDGRTFFLDDQGDCWRMLTYLEGTTSLTRIENEYQAQSLGEILARFHHHTASLDPARFHDPLPGFHHTPSYLGRYDRVLRQHPPLTDNELPLVACIEELRDSAFLLEARLAELTPLVTHGDPKVANFLFDERGTAAVSLIDLDTVRPGIILHDIGDALRSCCNPAGEDSDHASFSVKLLLGFLRGYARKAGNLLGRADRRHVVDAAMVISLELGLRFFTDHLTGNRYFRAEYPEQNLERAHVQLMTAVGLYRQRRELNELALEELDGNQ